MSARRTRIAVLFGGWVSAVVVILSSGFSSAGGLSQAAPQVLSLSPPANSHVASPTVTVSIVFDEAIDPQTVSPQSFAVHAMQSGLLQKTFKVNGATVALMPRAFLHCGEGVQVSATVDVRNASGIGPARPRLWQFQVAALGGTGQFSPSNAVQGGVSVRAVEVGDVDRDGDLDAFVGNENGANAIWFNRGFGDYIDSGQSLGSSHTLAVALGDVDGDGDLDAFVANEGGANRVWLNDGSGYFFDSGQGLGNSDSQAVVLGDVDGDGDLDAVVANDGGGDTKLWLNNGAGRFTDSGRNIGSGNRRAVCLADAENDGDLDVFVVGVSGTNKVWFNDGTGRFSDRGESLGDENGWTLALGDLDSDNDLDVVVGYENRASEVWLNDGAGRFIDSGRSLGTSSARTLALGDFDSDGDLDIFAGNSGGNNRVWFNDGSGVFQSGLQDLGGSDSRVATVFDADGDGDLDLFIGYEGGTNTIWLNQSPAVPPGRLRLQRPTFGIAGLVYTVTAIVSPITVTRPITYIWNVTDHARKTTTGGLRDAMDCRWDQPGGKTVAVEVDNDWGTLSVTQSVWVAWPGDTDVNGVIAATDPLVFSPWWHQNSEEQRALGDPSQDGQINIQDLLWLLEYWK